MKSQSRGRRERNRRGLTIRQVERLEGRQLLATITEFAIPSDTPRPTEITSGSDGNLWFSEANADKIGRITPSGTVTEFSLPAGSNPNSITSGPDGDIWFAATGTDEIGKITTTGSITEYSTSSTVGGITTGPDGALWFTEPTADKIGRITTDGTITEHATGGSYPDEIVAGADGNLWFTEYTSDEIGKIVPSGEDAGNVTLYPVSSGSQARGIALGTDGNIWFTEGGNDDIGRITPSGTVTEFSDQDAGSDPIEITSGPGGDLYFSQDGGNQIGRITTGGTVTAEYTVPTPGAAPDGITLGPDGNVWFVEFIGDQVGRLDLGTASTLTVGAASGTYGGTSNLQATLTTGGNPISGEAVDFRLGATDLGTATTGANGIATISDASLDGTDVGTYSGDVTASFAGDSTYSASSGSADLSVSPAALTITANNQTKVYGAALPTLTASYTGLVNGDTTASLTTMPAVTTIAAAASHVSGGPYAITASGAVDPNYTISYVSGSLSVTPAPLAISADDQSKVYGAATPSLTATYSGLVNGDTPGDLTTSPTMTTTAAVYSDVSGGPYAITASGAVDPDYAISYAAGNLTVTPAPLQIVIDNQNKVYGQANPTLTNTVTGVLDGDDFVAHFGTTATPSSGVGGYLIFFSGSSGDQADDYSPFVTGASISNGTLTVTPAPLTFTADDQTKVYGAALPTLTVTYSGFVNGDTPASLPTGPSLTTTATAASHVSGSPYAITVIAGDEENYSYIFVPGTLTVTPAPLTITADNQTKVYGAESPTLTASYSGLVNGDTPANLTTAPSLTTTATAASHVSGSPYAITPSGAADPDYAISYVNASLSVTPAPLTITADGKSKVYGAALPTLTASYSGFVNGDTPLNLTTYPTITSSATAASHVSGSPYAITPSGAADPDYAISYVAGSLGVTPAPLTITADGQTKIYGAALPTLTASYTGLVNGDTSASLETQPTLTADADAYSDVDGNPYAITVGGAAGSDYAITYLPGNLTVTPAPLVVAIDNQAKVYGQANPQLTGTVTGILNGDDVIATFVTEASQYSDVIEGGYAITVSGLFGEKADDYSTTIEGSSVTDGTLTVTPAPLTVVVADQSKVYGQLNPASTGVVSGILNGDDLGVTYGSHATQYSDVQEGGYAIAPTGLTGAKAADYSFAVEGASVTPGTLTVVRAPLAIAVDGQSKVYGQANPTLTGTVSGVLDGDDVVANYGTTATASSDVEGGGYAITFDGISGSKALDYSVTSSTPGTLTITPAPLTVTADDQSKVYGQANPAFTASFDGFVLGQTPSVLSGNLGFSTPATAASNVGVDAITPSGLSAADYAISFVGGSLSVTPAPLLVTANDVTSTYGQAVPTLSASYSGFVNGDTSSSLTTPVSLTTPASSASNVGSYPVVAGGATSGNYSISYANGTASVTPATLTVTPSDVTKAYGVAVPGLTATYSGFVNGDSAASLTSPVTLSTTATAGSNFGTYPITASGGSSPNYTIVDAPGTLTVPTNPAESAFVTSLYQYILGRTPEVAGLDGWIANLDNGEAEADVIEQIYDSTEATADRLAQGVSANSQAPGQIGLVTALYQNILGRLPETSGLAGWMARLEGGATVPSVAFQIEASSEAAADRVASTLPTAPSNADEVLLVTSLYETVLDREPETAGLDGWLAQLNGGESPADVAIQIYYSSEGVADRAASTPAPTPTPSPSPAPAYTPGQVAFVTSLYQSTLGRNPEGYGLSVWLVQLNSGVSPSSVANQIYHSEEAVSLRAHHKAPSITEAAAYAKALQAEMNA